MPRAPWPASSVTFGREVWTTSSTGVTPPSSLLRAHAPVVAPPTASVGKPCAAGLCRLRSAPTGTTTFPTLSLRTFPQMLGPLPRWILRCVCSFLPSGHRPSPCDYWVGGPRDPYSDFRTVCPFGAAVIHSRFRPPGLLAAQVAPTTASADAGQPRLRRSGPPVIPARSEPANRPNRAIDGMGTSTPPSPQSCRLLQSHAHFSVTRESEHVTLANSPGQDLSPGTPQTTPARGFGVRLSQRTSSTGPCIRWEAHLGKIPRYRQRPKPGRGSP